MEIKVFQAILYLTVIIYPVYGRAVHQMSQSNNCQLKCRNLSSELGVNGLEQFNYISEKIFKKTCSKTDGHISNETVS